MATAAAGWKVVHSASIIEETNTTAKIRVTGYWQNVQHRYNINYVSAWVYCNGVEQRVKNSGNVNSKDVGYTGKVSVGSYDYTINKGTSAQNISCYAKITSKSSYVQGTKSSTAANVTVAAKPSYTISYNANGGSGAPGNQTKWYGDNLVLSSAKPTRTGHSFVRWNTNTSNTGTAYNPGATYTGNSSLTLYAIWKANTFTVTYNANGGSGAPSNQTKTYGVNLTLSSTKPTRINYIFKGWSTSPNGGVVYAAGATYTGNAAITLYAVWGIAYRLPRLTNFKVDRCDSSGTLDESGTYAKVTFDWNSDNTVTSIKINWCAQGSNTWNTVNVTASGTSGSVSQIIGNNSLDIETSYLFKASVSDSGGTTPSSQLAIGTIKFPIDVKDKGTGVAIGKASELDAFEVAMDMYVKGEPLAEHIGFIKHNNYALHSISDSVFYVRLNDLELGGVYEVSVVYNPNTDGSTYYRSILFGILSVTCGYDSSTSSVVVRPKFDVISNYRGTEATPDSRVEAVCEGGGSTLAVGTFLSSPHLYVYITNSAKLEIVKVNVRKISM